MALEDIDIHFPSQFPFHLFHEDIWKLDIKMNNIMVFFIGSILL